MKKIIIIITCFLLVTAFTTEAFSQATYFRSICQGDTVMYWGNIYSQTGTYNNGSEILYLQVDNLPPSNLVVPGITLCSPQDSLFATCNYNSTATAYWYVSSANSPIIYQIPLGSGYRPTQAGTFLAVVTNGCGADSAFVTVNSCAPFNKYTTVCGGDSIFFNNKWLKQAGTYTDSSAIVDTILHLTVDFAPDTIVIQSSGNLCNSTLTAYSANISNFVLTNSQYRWMLNGIVVGNASTFNPVSVGTYTITAYNSCGSDTITYTVNSVCTYSSTSDTICAGDSVLFNNKWLTQAGTYRDTIQNGGVSNISTLNLIVNGSVDTIVIYAPNPICNTDLYAFAVNLSDSVLVSYQYIWKFNGNTVGTGNSFQPTTAGTYTVLVPNTCGGYSSASYIVPSTCTYSNISDTICKGDSLLFNNQWLKQAGTYRDTIQNGTIKDIVSLKLIVSYVQLNVYIYVDASCSTYLVAYDSTSHYSLSQINWTYNGNVIGYGQILNLVTAGTYTAIEYGICGNDTVSVVVLPCNIDTSDVWSGDADNNGIADNNDLLAIGIGYGINGAARPNASLVWQAESCNNWSNVFLDGTNLKHADCDGNGIINANDTLAVIQNFALTHNKNEDEPSGSRSDIPTLYVVFEKDSLNNGDTLVASIRLGDASIPASNIYGLAFTYNFDHTVVDTSSVQLSYTNSWLGNNSDKISIAKEFYSSGKIKTAVTRIDHSSRSGYGEIAQFRAIVTAASNNTVYFAKNFITSLNAVGRQGDPIVLNEGIDSVKINAKTTGIGQAEDNIEWLLYPNPANSSITIKGIENIEGIVIYNAMGEKVYTETNHGKQDKTVDVSNLPAGVYTAQTKTSKGSGEKRFVVAR